MKKRNFTSKPKKTAPAHSIYKPEVIASGLYHTAYKNRCYGCCQENCGSLKSGCPCECHQ